VDAPDVIRNSSADFLIRPASHFMLQRVIARAWRPEIEDQMELKRTFSQLDGTERTLLRLVTDGHTLQPFCPG
jgi:FixJ family two-component response regulator